MNDVSQIRTEDLIRRFEVDVVFAGCRAPRFGPSVARQELLGRAHEALGPIVAHLKTRFPTDIPELNTGWGHLVREIGSKIPVKSSAPMPQDMAGWIPWAEKMILPIRYSNS